jgi:MOSC domain-containing protein YiiM
MSESNIQPGDRVRIGNVELEMTPKPHNGCAKFVARYGLDALRVVNSPEGKKRHLRGIYFKVIKDGTLRKGDKIEKIPRG